MTEDTAKSLIEKWMRLAQDNEEAAKASRDHEERANTYEHVISSLLCRIAELDTKSGWVRASSVRVDIAHKYQSERINRLGMVKDYQDAVVICEWARENKLHPELVKFDSEKTSFYYDDLSDATQLYLKWGNADDRIIEPELSQSEQS